MKSTPPENSTTQPKADCLLRIVRHLDLFSGIGGFALAARWLGNVETVGFCEIDPYAVKVLEKNFPGTPIHDDVRNTQDFKKYEGTIDIITGGYPCQPFSVAGHQGGEDDDRHLWPAMLDVIKQVRPTWVLAENVAGHIKLGLDQVLSDLEANSYSARAVVIPACAKDAPHRRDRVWIIAHSKSKCSAGEILAKLSEKKQREPRGDFIKSPSAHFNSQRSSRQREHRRSVHTEQDKEGEKHRAFNADQFKIPWMEVAASLCRVDDGVSRGLDSSERIKGCGNAIVPHAAYEIMKAMRLGRTVHH